MQGNNSNLFQNAYRIPSARLQEWDYSSPGYYFVTICVKDKACFFGDIVGTEEEPGAEMDLSPSGRMIEECWLSIPKHYDNTSLEKHQIMPNHFHGILIIDEQKENITLGLIINQFKAACTKKIREAGYRDFAWQERFYDHVIRNEKDLERIRNYVHENPAAWLRGEDDEW